MAKKSRAVSSQGTHFYIQQLSGTGTDATITAITKANPAVVTATAHGFANGAVVSLAGIVGMVELNGVTAAIKRLTADTFELVGVDSSEFTNYTSGGEATSLVFIETCQHKSYSGFDGQASEKDRTTLCSTAKEKGIGLQDFGGMSAEMNYVEDDPFQVEFKLAKGDNVGRWFRIQKANKFWKIWFGYPRSLSDSGGLDGDNLGTAAVTIDGEVYEIPGV